MSEIKKSDDQPPTKFCGKCKLDKTLSEFNKDNSKKDGLKTMCRECQKSCRKDQYLTQKYSSIKSHVQKSNLREKSLKKVDEMIKSRNVIGMNDDELIGYKHILESAIMEMDYIVNMKRNDIISISVTSDIDFHDDVDGKMFEQNLKQSLEKAIAHVTDEFASQIYMKIINISLRRRIVNYSKEGHQYKDDDINEIKKCMRSDQIAHVIRID